MCVLDCLLFGVWCLVFGACHSGERRNPEKHLTDNHSRIESACCHSCARRNPEVFDCLKRITIQTNFREIIPTLKKLIFWHALHIAPR